MKAKIPLVQALAWIVGSMILVSGFGYSGFKFWLAWKRSQELDPQHHIVAIIQTGPQKEALKTDYLAELLRVAVDRPVSIFRFDCQLAEQRLRRSPVIKEARVKVIRPGAVYVDYTVYQPVAWIFDFENTAIDENGYLFPVSPFFSPKKLPEIYLGLPPFGVPPEEPEREMAQWGVCRQDRYTRLALAVLKLLSESSTKDLFNVVRIDVSNAYAESYGVREIVLRVEDRVVLKEGAKEICFELPRILRLSTKNYAAELGNYLQLREQLLQREIANLTMPKEAVEVVKLPDQIIDFRIPKLAFIDQ